LRNGNISSNTTVPSGSLATLHWHRGGGADLTVNPEEAVRGVGNCTLRQTVTSRFIGQFANRNIASLPANRPKEGRVKTTTRLMWLKVHIGGAQARH